MSQDDCRSAGQDVLTPIGTFAIRKGDQEAVVGAQPRRPGSRSSDPNAVQRDGPTEVLDRSVPAERMASGLVACVNLRRVLWIDECIGLNASYGLSAGFG